MRTVDWLPAEPLSVADCAELASTADGVHAASPVFGLMPTPKETVVVVFADRRDGVLWAAFHPDEGAWVELEAGEPAHQLTRHAQVADDVLEFVEEAYPGRQVGLLKQAFATG